MLTCAPTASIVRPILWTVAYGLGLVGAIVLAAIKPDALLLESAKRRPAWSAIGWVAVAASFLGQIVLAWVEYCGLR